MKPFIWFKTRDVNQGAPEEVAEKPYENGLQKRSFFDINYVALKS